MTDVAVVDEVSDSHRSQFAAKENLLLQILSIIISRCHHKEDNIFLECNFAFSYLHLTANWLISEPVGS